MATASTVLYKRTYLSQEPVIGFIEFLRGLVAGAPLPAAHVFSVRDRKLYVGYAFLVQQTQGARGLRIDSLEGAFDRYWWNRGNFAANDEVLKALREEVLTALDTQGTDEQRLDAHLSAICAVLRWGAGGTGLKLYRENMRWARENASTLVRRIRLARDAIDADVVDLSVFGGDEGARMNAGYTKLFALACRASIIYDGRVGAALGLLTRMFCTAQKLSTVPEELAFRWGGQTSTGRFLPLPRNPSRGPLAFPALNTSDRIWARWNVQANWILGEVQQGADADWCRGPDGLRRIEAALFTIGYHLP
ncbi:hypothetical protein [Mitsuaria sp. GD03876]|uniref:hypothetical protein n=1 Tax=Mitsuaria sp. GD03876 TaxID=2975399 RepID=UPI002446B426|nr:hypothetical protein [Mitsuaria sp. GD03876]MDH0865857.1 hypothetical protein [Mitsuaria sp. GD03876]